uniref:Uncharacterized protein n=1 Tax=Rheum australe TaxID=284363 RepID=B5M1Z3_RHEAU|nr:hypothetical protein [Rheum australe]
MEVVQRSKIMELDNNPITTKRVSYRERKLALQQDVDKLKKKLRHEENVHRALERAFTRPLGMLPRLPPYLPSYTLELLAEVAVLEEEVVRLEEQIVLFRKDLYQEAVYISSSKSNVDSLIDFYESNPSKRMDKERENRALERAFTRPLGMLPRLPPYLPSYTLELLAEVAVLEEEVVRLEEQIVLFRKDLHQEAVYISSSKSNVDSLIDFYESNPSKRMDKEREISVSQVEGGYTTSAVGMKNKQPKSKAQLIQSPIGKRFGTQKSQVECRTNRLEFADVSTLPQVDRNLGDNSPNAVSESIIKCLMTILFRMRRTKSKSIAEQLPSLYSYRASENKEALDPYNICSELRRDIGPYKSLCSVDVSSINSSQTASTLFLLRRLKILFEKLASVKLEGLTHQEKLAFWINVYNSCMMNAFIEQGIPESPETVVALMQKAKVNVGGQQLNAITIEHFILRLPYHSKYTFSKGARNDEKTARSMFGLELSEPLVTFALSCGSWSSPAVRVYTASQVENELEVAKREYLHASVGISRTRKLMIPKVMDWYLLDFAKDLESLLDWICLQLPVELRKEAIKCLERGKDESLSQRVQVMSYEFSFRYLLANTNK